MKRYLLASAIFILGSVAAIAQAVVRNAGVPISNLTNAAQSVKPARGTLAWLSCSGAQAGGYLQFFDTTASVTVGVTVPKFWLPISASPAFLYSSLNVSFVAAIQVAYTTTPTGGSAPSSNANCAFGVN